MGLFRRAVDVGVETKVLLALIGLWELRVPRGDLGFVDENGVRRLEQPVPGGSSFPWRGYSSGLSRSTVLTRSL